MNNNKYSNCTKLILKYPKNVITIMSAQDGLVRPNKTKHDDKYPSPIYLTVSAKLIDCQSQVKIL